MPGMLACWLKTKLQSHPNVLHVHASGWVHADLHPIRQLTLRSVQLLSHLQQASFLRAVTEAATLNLHLLSS